MNEKIVLQTAKTLNKEKFVLEKLNKQIDNLKEKENYLKKELEESYNHLEKSKFKEQEIKEANLQVKMIAEEEILKNKKDHSELTLLRDMKKNVQKELNRAIQDNLNAKYSLDAQREQKKALQVNLSNLQDNYSVLNNEKENLNSELLI